MLERRRLSSILAVVKGNEDWSEVERLSEKFGEGRKKQGNRNGADVVFECVGKMETLSQAISLATISGKICTVGNPDTNMTLEKDIYWKILRNQLTIIGTWNSSFFKLM